MVKPGGGRLWAWEEPRLLLSQVSLPPPISKAQCALGERRRGGGPGSLSHGRPGPRPRQVQWPPPARRVTCCLRPLRCAPHPRLRGECGSAGARPKDSGPASFLSPALYPSKKPPWKKGPRACFLPLRSRQEKTLAGPGLRNRARDWAGRSCFGEQCWGPHPLRP